MATQAASLGGRRWRRRAIAGWASAAALILVPFLAMLAMAATAADENVVLTRNEVVREAAGGRTWRGAMTNVTDNVFRDVSVQILFVDADGQAIGTTRGRADRLDPGQGLELAARLPADATGMQVYALRFLIGPEGDRGAAMGPYARWPFGYVHRDWPCRPDAPC